jgi:hypothetical protein
MWIDPENRVPFIQLHSSIPLILPENRQRKRVGVVNLYREAIVTHFLCLILSTGRKVYAACDG